jgi:DNA-binding response OmpR family regulator
MRTDRTDLSPARQLPGTANDLRRIPKTQARGGTESKPVSTERKCILIVDDDAMIRESLAVVLQMENYEVRLADNGRTAIRTFMEGPPDLILLDLNMPDTDGWKAFEVMGRLAPYVPVIVITARPYQSRRAAEAGIDMLLEKPLDIPVLLETIRNLLAQPGESRLGRVLRMWHTNGLAGNDE